MAADANVMAQRATPQDFKSWRFPLLKRRSEKVGVETRICFIRYISRTTSKYVCVSAQRQKMRQKNDCKRVCLEKVFPQLYIWLLKNMTLGMCFHKNMGTRMCMRMQKQQWKGNAIVFPTLTTIVLGNAYVIFFVPPPD